MNTHKLTSQVLAFTDTRSLASCLLSFKRSRLPKQHIPIRAVAKAWQLLVFVLLFQASLFPVNIQAQRRRPPTGGRLAVVVDERLSTLRSTPQLSGKLLRRLGRGRLVAIRGIKRSEDGIVFFLVNVTARTHGWIQREAVVSSSSHADEQRLLGLIKGSAEFDRIARARIFLDLFPRSSVRSEVLLMFGDAAEDAAARLSRDASRRINEGEIRSLDAPTFSYFLNYSGLDRYNRQGVGFIFASSTKRFHYDGTSWREIVRRYPTTPEAAEARKRLGELAAVVQSPEP
jgi:hypothetical protein